MDRELACEIVKDLLPLYVDGMVSDVSQKSIEKHLEDCTDCNGVYHSMAFNLEKETQPSEVQDVKRFLKKTKHMYLFYGLSCLCFIAILVCMIVDLAVNKGITWSLIVTTAVIFADALVYVLSVCKKNKGYIAMAVVSIGTFCLLSVIQLVRYYLMDAGTVWIFRFGFPIMLLWLGILWIPMLFRAFFKWNIWDCIAVFMVLTAVGNYITKLITGDYVWNDVLRVHNFMANALGLVIAAFVFFLIGRVKKWRK
ncbi:MAG: zf-HC2 domain-containing protein [Lachnospiraceae bacterium]|nr:zf-HC2 domain-containing protein [Lachnospiraceae bacterium]